MEALVPNKPCFFRDSRALEAQKSAESADMGEPVKILDLAYDLIRL